MMMKRKYAVITGFWGKLRDRFIDYQPHREMEEMIEMASKIKGCSGLEAVYPQNFSDPVKLKQLVKRYNLDVSTLGPMLYRDWGRFVLVVHRHVEIFDLMESLHL
jgi:sugar phosphate isomerase/epimerase